MKLLPIRGPKRGLVLAPLCDCTHFCGQAPVKEPYRCLHLPRKPECPQTRVFNAPFTGTPYDPDSEED